jgi:hypothetical protein
VCVCVSVKYGRKTPPARLSHRWKHVIAIDVKEMECELVDWIHLAQDTVQWRTVSNTAMNLRAP